MGVEGEGEGKKQMCPDLTVFIDTMKIVGEECSCNRLFRDYVAGRCISFCVGGSKLLISHVLNHKGMVEDCLQF